MNRKHTTFLDLFFYTRRLITSKKLNVTQKKRRRNVSSNLNILAKLTRLPSNFLISDDTLINERLKFGEPLIPSLSPESRKSLFSTTRRHFRVSFSSPRPPPQKSSRVSPLAKKFNSHFFPLPPSLLLLCVRASARLSLFRFILAVSRFLRFFPLSRFYFSPLILCACVLFPYRKIAFFILLNLHLNVFPQTTSSVRVCLSALPALRERL